MKIYITGLPSGYEVEHLVRLFYPMAPLTLTPPEAGEDCVWAEKKPDGLWAMVRQGGKCAERSAPLPAPAEAGGETPEFSLASLTYDLLRRWTGIRPPWGKMTGVRPVRLIHDKRAAGWSEAEIDRFFLGRFDCSEQKYQMARAIANLQEPILRLGSEPKTYSLYIGIPFCPSRCSYCSFVSRTVGDKATRALVQPYVDKLCAELTAIRETADRCGLHIRTFYIGGGTPTSLSAAQLEQLMSHIAKTFDLAKLDEYTVEAGRPDCTDAEKLAVIKEYGATRISINPQTFSDEVLAGIGRKHSAQDILDCYAEARKAGHDDINMDLIAGLPGEGEKEFEELCDFLREEKIERAGVFPFSPEEGTKAATMEHVPMEEAQRRTELLVDVQSDIIDEYNESVLGDVREVLCEGWSEEAQSFVGRSYAESVDIDGKIYFSANCDIMAGEFVNVRLTGTMDGELTGEAVE